MVFAGWNYIDIINRRAASQAETGTTCCIAEVRLRRQLIKRIIEMRLDGAFMRDAPFIPESSAKFKTTRFRKKPPRLREPAFNYRS